MKSKRAKILHPIAGKAMIEYACDIAQQLGLERPIVVIGYQGEQVRAALGDRALCVEQPIPRGTGDAVKYARAALGERVENVLVYYADMPLLKSETLAALMDKHRAAGATLTMLTAIVDEPMAFGRIVRDTQGRVVRIVEESEATPAELAIRELNAGVYCFKSGWLWENLERLVPSRTKGEYYLTDLLEIAATQNEPVETVTIDDKTQVIGINNRAQLAAAERIMRDRIRERVMLDGATLVDPATIYIDAHVEIGPDSVILPGTHLQGRTRIGSDCCIGPNAIIRDSTIGDGCIIGPSVIEAAVLEDHVEVGPFCHLRPGAYLARHVHLGNFAEVKNARLGERVHMGHFSYVGDAEVGARTNIGAGAITCNYDGKTKHRTTIGEDVFIGSDSMLVAPVTVGARARTGAGAVVIKDVPPDSLVVGVPARVIRRITEEG